MRELDLVEWIKRQKNTRGIGDDCYIYGNLVFTTDLMVEGIHFRRTDKPEFVGQKTLARGLSDIAAMGADPRFCLFSLARPKWADDKWVKAFFRGVLKLKVPWQAEISRARPSWSATSSFVARRPKAKRSGATQRNQAITSTFPGGSAPTPGTDIPACPSRVWNWDASCAAARPRAWI